MGWTSVNKDSSITPKDFLASTLTWNDFSEEERPSIIATAQGNNTIAFAVKFPAEYLRKKPESYTYFERDKDGAITTAILFIYRISKGEFNFSYEEMEESFGPYHYVSDKILRHLSPLREGVTGVFPECVYKWRIGCNAFSDAIAFKKSIKPGMILKFPTPLKFRTFECDTFKAVSKGKGKIYYLALSGELVRLPDISSAVIV